MKQTLFYIPRIEMKVIKGSVDHSDRSEIHLNRRTTHGRVHGRAERNDPDTNPRSFITTE